MKLENKHLLKEGFEILELTLNKNQFNQLVTYHDLLSEANKKFNLTGHKDEKSSVIFNLLNSLSAAKIVRDKIEKKDEVADIGSGAGFPGIPWAVVLNFASIYLVESKQKKAEFLRRVVKELNLKNVEIINKNALELKMRFSNIVFQAFGKPGKVIKTAKQILKPAGSGILFASGTDSIEEAFRIESTFDYEILPFKIPFAEDHKRNLVIFKNR